ncbi:hypothetical protein [Nitrosomonas communis]|uniref:Uncharacterized protein n=1 Tax=Nitrosomonas communis TaxID=44574 RepID=A0A1I4WVY7_9PROT|nr:hypothetical protein [Nitrosomonas communis]SFN17333.1 hypothetical protein SAMN05421863_11215 [Nitrosomonas communis]
MSDIRIHKTGEPDIIQASDGRITLSVPIQIKRRSGRKLVTLPNGETAKARTWNTAAIPLQLACWLEVTAGLLCWSRGKQSHSGRSRSEKV